MALPKTKGIRNNLAQAVFVGSAVFLLIGIFFSMGWFDRLEWLASDSLARLAATHVQPHPDFQFIVLDQKSLDAGKEEFGLAWPWPRETYGQVVEFLQHAQARVVFLDFIFSEPSVYSQEDDLAMTSAFHRFQRLYLSLVAKPKSADSGGDHLYEVRPDIFLQPQLDHALELLLQQGVTLPIPQVLESVKGFGDVRMNADEDGVVRRIAPLVRMGKAYLPHLGLAPLLQDQAAVTLSRSTLHWGEQFWPLDAKGNLVLRYPGYWSAYPKTSMIDIVTSNVALKEGSTPTVDPRQFKDKIVVIGSTAEGLFDLRKTALEPKTPGFYVTAAVFANVLDNSFYNERWRVPIFWLSLLVLVALGSLLGQLSFGRGLFLGLLLGGVFLAKCSWLFFSLGMITVVVSPLLGLIVAFGLSMGLSYRREQKHKAFIQNAFSQVLSKTVLDALLRNPEKLSAGGEVADLSIYFSDLAGFTQFSEKLSPQDLVAVLNLYLDNMVETIVDENEGYVDKFIGDAVMAFWNAPISMPDHALRACRAAIQNQAKLQKLQDALHAKGLDTPLAMRIGLHSGPAVVGMVGSHKKLNYTIMGDAVNLASRLEGVNKQYGTHILASWEIISQVQDQILYREIDRIRVKGKQEPTRIFEIVGLAGQVDKKTGHFLDVFKQGTDLYWQRKFKAALAVFTKAAGLRPEDQPSQMFVDRSRRYALRPPGPKWDGVTTLKTK